MQAKFPLQQKATELGLISDPVVPIEVLTRTGYQKFDFIVDTGADCSIMPKSVAKDLAVDIRKAVKMHFGGIEGRSILTYIVKITVKITKTPIAITCALSSNEQCPFILGRKDVFSRYNILFDNKSKTINFVSIDDL